MATRRHILIKALLWQILGLMVMIVVGWARTGWGRGPLYPPAP